MAAQGNSRWKSRTGGTEEADRPNESWHILRSPGGAVGREEGSPGSIAIDLNGDGFEEVIDLTGLASRPNVGFIIRGDTDYDYAGGSVSSAGDINGDGFDDLIIGAPFGDDGGSDAGAAYVIFGRASGLGSIDLASLTPTDGFMIQGDDAGDWAGTSVSSAGDINGDGFDDLIVGAPYTYDADPRHGGDAYVLFGKSGGFGTIDLTDLASNPTAGFIIHANEVGDLAGFSVSGAGDVNGDGFDDLIVGAWQAGEDESVGGADHGEAYVIFGKASGFSEFDLAILDPIEANYDPSAGFMISAPDGAADSVGFSVSSAGDINADGYDDVIVGAPYSGGFNITGAAYVLFGTAGNFSSIDLGDLAPEDGFIIIGSGADDGMAGWSVSSAGDVNGDGYDELIIGAPFANVTGEAYVIFGKAGGFGTIDLANLGAAGFTIVGDANLDGAGLSVSDAGDVNGDGFDDVIVGAPYGDDGGSRAGKAYVIFGKAGGFGTVDLGNLGTAGFTIQGDTAGDLAGRSVSAAGDINSDGFDDLIVGAPFFNDAATVPGAAYVIFGQAPTVAVTRIGSVIGQTINGGAFNDTLDGQGGNDTLVGGNGNDSYIVDSAGDVVTEAVAGGYDTAYTLMSYTLTAASEIEVLTVYDRDTASAINLTGNGFANVIYGNNGSNTLIGDGGADTFYGLGGDDRYLVDSLGDRVLEAAGGGYDTVYTVGDFALNNASAVEALTVYDRDTTNALTLFGNDLDNVIYGNQGDNSLYGGGGVDTFYGLGGNDSYLVDGLTDQVFELAGQGYDTVYSTGDVALNNFSFVEALSVYDRNTSNALTLFGNNLDNVIYGNQGSNALLGGGGEDTLYGLGGDDRYFVDSLGDQVIEAAGGGNDTIYTTLGSYQLITDQSVETLTVYDRDTTYAANLTGNNLAQFIYGNAGANNIDGKGGADTLYGMAGADIFTFTNGPLPGAADALADFSAADDTIALDDEAFLGIGGAGALSANAFVVGSQAADADDRIVYNQATGQIFFDADGNGSGGQVLFATVNAGTVLSASDFMVI